MLPDIKKKKKKKTSPAHFQSGECVRMACDLDDFKLKILLIKKNPSNCAGIYVRAAVCLCKIYIRRNLYLGMLDVKNQGEISYYNKINSRRNGGI